VESFIGTGYSSDLYNYEFLLKMSEIMKRAYIYIFILLGVLLASCENTWDEHFSGDNQVKDISVWEEIVSNTEYSQFKNGIEEFGLQSYFQNSDSVISTKTVFLPTNEAFDSFKASNFEPTESLILYHLVKSYFLLSNIDGNLKSQAQNLKFLYFEENEGKYTIDGVEISEVSTRLKDGIIYQMDEVLLPKPSIAEYLQENASYFGNYITSFDSVIMDYTNSEIIEIDYENDRVIYDSVYTVYNEFKEKYFDVDYNTRDTFATLLLYTDAQFYSALDLVADDLGYPSGQDLPVKWIEDVYFEYYLKTAFYNDLLTYNDLSQDFAINILGDTVEVDYTNLYPDHEICSNGLIYQYKDLIIPEELYKSEARTEGEGVVFYDDQKKKIFLNEEIEYIFKDKDGANLSIEGNIAYVLGAQDIASNDSAIQITLGPGFDGSFEIEIPVLNVFPGRYFLDWAGFSTISGVFKVYVNDKLLYTRLPFEPASDPGSVIEEFDSFNFGNFTLADLSKHESGIDWGSLRATNSSWNINEFYVESNPADPDEYYLKEFGDVIVRFEYISPSPSNPVSTGIVIDYLNLRQR
jgi:uncharacterized surface protein with fasciclin (FAS1) repeats